MKEVSSESNDAEYQLADWIAGLSAAQLPRTATDVARACIADGIGVMLAGSRSPVFEQCEALPQSSGRCSVVGRGVTTDVRTAAFLNAVACHALDFDDTCYAGIVHGTAVVLPAVLAVAQELDVNGEQMLEAYVAGVETEYALGLALSDSLYERGVWTTAALGVIGAAAGVAKLLKLKPSAGANAIRLAANMPIGLRATHGSSGKPYLAGLASRLGVDAAYAAQVGICGQPHTFERPRGFAYTLNGGKLDRSALSALGLRFALTDPGVAFKLYPLCSATQAAVEAAIAMRAEYGFSAPNVKTVICRATPFAAKCLPYMLPTMPSEAQFSMTFAIACALLHNDVKIEHLSETTLADVPLRQLMSRIELVQDSTLVSEQNALAYPEAARVEIMLFDGQSFDLTVLAAKGMPTHPATEEQLLNKFLRCATRAIEGRHARTLWERSRHIECVPSARHLFDGISLTGSA